MLVIQRKEGERMVLVFHDSNGTTIEAWISVEEIQGYRVRLGITAPKETVNIARQEVYDPTRNQTHQSNLA